MPKTTTSSEPALTSQQRAGRASARHRQVDAVARRIEALVAAAPPLTAAQVQRLHSLLPPLAADVMPAAVTPTRGVIARGSRAVADRRA